MGIQRVIRVGSRDSVLAVAQTKIVMEAISRAHPEFRLELVAMKTAGDKSMKPFAALGDPLGIKGLFTQELEDALSAGRLDVAVHSLKDLPAVKKADYPVVALSRRADPRDVLVAPAGSDGGTGPIGCSSVRRRIQLARLFPGRALEPLRGNVITRVKKLDEGQFGAIVLAAAGLVRLGLERRATRFFSAAEILPAAGQGILACQGRAGEDYEYLNCVRDRDSKDCSAAEGAFVARLDGGCSAPVAAYAEVCGSRLKLSGLYGALDGSWLLRGESSGERSDAARIGEDLARDLLKRGE